MLQNDELWGQARHGRNDMINKHPIRSFSQIARLLSEQHGQVMSALHVMRICRTAEAKLVNALLGDPAIRRVLCRAVALVN